jgi:hypothetical protein
VVEVTVELAPTVVIGLVTGAMALAGVLYTQWRSDQREHARLKLDREHRHARWFLDERRKAHLDFLTAQYEISHAMAMYARVDGPPPPDDWSAPLAAKLPAVQVFASAEAANAAQDVLRATSGTESGTPGSWQNEMDALDHYRRLVQGDLDLEVTDLRPWASEEVQTIPYDPR